MVRLSFWSATWRWCRLRRRETASKKQRHTAMTTPTTSAAFGADGVFDESKLAKPSDWAALDDFDEEALLVEMSSRVEATFLEAKEEVQREKKSGADDISSSKFAALPEPPKIAANDCGPITKPAVASKAGVCCVCGAAPGAGQKLKRCTACKCVSYCSRECQTQDWPSHKGDCKRLKEEKAAAAEAKLDLSALDD